MRIKQRRWNIIALFSIVFGILVSIVSSYIQVIESPAAHALSHGAGIHILPGEVNFAGAYVHTDGSLTYCIEIDSTTRSTTADPDFKQSGIVRAYSGHAIYAEGRITADEITGDEIAVMNRILGEYGNTADAAQAATVQLAIWEIRKQHGGNDAYNKIMNRVFAASEQQAPGITARALQMIADARAVIAQEKSVGVAPNGQMQVQVTDGYSGVLTAPKDTTFLRVVGGQLKDPATGNWVGELTTAPLSSSVSYSWRGTPDVESGWNRYYTVSFSGKTKKTWEETTPELMQTQETELQTTVKRSESYKLTKSKEDELSAVTVKMDTLWKPIVTTQVPSQYVAHGTKFGDNVRFDAQSGGAPWRYYLDSNGQKKYLPILAKGTLYGPFLDNPALNPRDTPPNGAPIAYKTQLVTSEDKGPGEYPVATDFVAQESGYYTWVWEIRADDQGQNVRVPVGAKVTQSAQSLPDNFAVTDGFGRVAEGQTTPVKLDIQTAANINKLGVGGSFADSVKVNPADGTGGWLHNANGKRYPVKLRGQAYYSREKPIRQPIVPVDAKPFGEAQTLVFDEENKAQNSADFKVPLTTDAGFVTVVWCALPEDQEKESKNKFARVCDDYGVPAETVEITRPKVTTKATEQAVKGAEISDTAKVSGDIHAGVKYELTFSAYHRKPGDSEKLCKPENLVFESRHPIPVTGAGEYKSDTFKTENIVGEIYWVETLWAIDDKQQKIKMHTGKCGEAEEITTVKEPPVVLAATGAVLAGGGGLVGVSMILIGLCAMIKRRKS